jgi:hypothetical protein
MHAGPAGRVITPDPGRRTHGKPGIQGGSYARLAQRATGARAAGRPVGCLRVCVRPRLAAVGAPKSPGGRYMGLWPLARRAAGRSPPPSPTAALVTVRCRACGASVDAPSPAGHAAKQVIWGPHVITWERPRTARACNTRSGRSRPPRGGLGDAQLPLWVRGHASHGDCNRLRGAASAVCGAWRLAAASSAWGRA